MVLGLLGLFGAIAAETLVRQQAIARIAMESARGRAGMRDALELLGSDSRSVSVADTVRLMTDSAVEFFSTVGESLVCKQLSSQDVGLPTSAPRNPPGLSSFTLSPDTGDLARIYDKNVGRWQRYRIASFSTKQLSVTCPTASGFSSAADVTAGANGNQLTVVGSAPAEIRAGSPIRFLRRARYSLYKSSDGKWYLGYRRCNALGSSICGAIQPVTGPYQPYSTDRSRSGLVFRYFDSSGVELAPGSNPSPVRRIGVTARVSGAQTALPAGIVAPVTDFGDATFEVRRL